MLHKKLKNDNIILASKSPRRQFLLKELGIPFTIIDDLNIEETYPENLQAEHIAIYLAELKASYLQPRLKDKDIVITADTIVWINNHILNKPQNYEEAKNMLQILSGNMHQVLTGVCLYSKRKKLTFYANTNVYFKRLSEEEITFYLDNYKPYDKAGSYGIQEWIGYIGIESIEGSYFNVMGLPIQRLYQELLEF